MTHYRNSLTVALRNLPPQDQLDKLLNEMLWLSGQVASAYEKTQSPTCLTQTANGDLKVRNSR